MAPGEFRLRIGYPKEHRLRFLSHLEVTHALERSIRRARIPYAVTRGFNPHMKVAFGPALPVGTASVLEYVDIWTTTYVPAEEIVDLLALSTPADLTPERAGYVPSAEPSLSSACTLGEYEVVIEGEGATAPSVGTAIEAVIADGELRTERKGKQKVYELAHALSKEPCVRSAGTGVVVNVTTRMGPQGSLRPDVLIAEAISRSSISASIAAVTRTACLIEDDEGRVRAPL